MSNFFSDKDPDEIIILSVDFATALNEGERVLSGAWDIRRDDGSAEDTAPMRVGSTGVIDDKIVAQSVQGGAHGATYLHRAIARTSTNRVLVHGVKQSVKWGG